MKIVEIIVHMLFTELGLFYIIHMGENFSFKNNISVSNQCDNNSLKKSIYTIEKKHEKQESLLAA